MNKEGKFTRYLILIVVILTIINFIHTPASKSKQEDAIPVTSQSNQLSQVKETKQKFEYRQAKEVSGATSYIFEGNEKPRLDITANGSIGDLSTINKILTYLYLPQVAESVPERSSVTGYRFHRAQYYWEEYPLGPLTVNRSICGSGSNQYDCVWKVTVAEKNIKQ